MTESEQDFISLRELIKKLSTLLGLSVGQSAALIDEKACRYISGHIGDDGVLLRNGIAIKSKTITEIIIDILRTVESLNAMESVKAVLNDGAVITDSDYDSYGFQYSFVCKVLPIGNMERIGSADPRKFDRVNTPQPCATADREDMVATSGHFYPHPLSGHAPTLAVAAMARQAVEQDKPGHISPSLATLNRAAREFWSSADPDDNSTHPINRDVIDWLIKQGITKESAEQGAVIIRPEWARKGRPTKK